MIGFYNYTVILTYIGLVSTFIGITQVFNGKYLPAMFCLLVSGLCDMFDGVVARTHKTRSEDAKKFGIQIDSLCDVICFGVFPAIINYAYTLHFNSDYTVLAICISSFFVLAAITRLGYFNVMEEKRQKTTKEVRKAYQGLPVTTVALILPGIYMLRQRLIALDVNFAIVINIACVIVGLLFILNIPIPKAHKRGIILMTVLGIAMLVILILQFNGVTSF
ncbi:MAG: CDP-alcohol phosphatidyltransferase family protein [Lachnospiraceae bacterium]|nr:CDP-alcohol phosphatidyltransferase family protein [Lachnospiraceae bacterium]